MAIEDVGLADPERWSRRSRLCRRSIFWRSRGDQALAQAAIYLSVSQKSDAAYQALNRAHQEVAKGVPEPVPMHLRNPVTRSMKEWGYGEGYQHAHNYDDAMTDMECLPPSLAGKRFYSRPGGAWRNALRSASWKFERPGAKSLSTLGLSSM